MKLQQNFEDMQIQVNTLGRDIEAAKEELEEKILQEKKEVGNSVQSHNKEILKMNFYTERIFKYKLGIIWYSWV